ncbi:hypothetical protein [Archangium sp.]|uniref:hypothetical protein n=1 Tax=Archangium sp. TaxID=1872627 RepID=UPI002D51EC65|nr:hypothetical protein [Archangium sp.]HYO55415.1 hypothetical protein [Archangium sp.]
MSALLRGKVLLAICLALAVSGCGDSDDLGATPMGNGEIIALAPGQKDSWVYYKMIVPPGTYEMKLRTLTFVGDTDIYAQFGKLPTLTSYKYKSASSTAENPREDFLVGEVPAGDLYIGIYGASDYDVSFLVAFANSEQLPKLASFTLGSSTVKGGESVKGIVELEAPAPPGGMSIAIDSSKPQFMLPLTLTPTIPAGSKRLEFDIPTMPVEETVKLLVVSQFNYVGQRIPIPLTITP